MPQFDNRKAAGVWQRVHASADSPTGDAGMILALIPELSAWAQACPPSSPLRSPFHTQATALRGIYTLLTGQFSRPIPQGKASPLNAAALRKCYTCQLRALSQYQTLCGREDFGPAFQALIPLAQNTLVTILSQLGAMQK
jgi:hypothetical protein